MEQGLKNCSKKLSKRSSQILKELGRATKELRSKRKRLKRSSKSKSNKIFSKRSTNMQENNPSSPIFSKSKTNFNKIEHNHSLLDQISEISKELGNCLMQRSSKICIIS